MNQARVQRGVPTGGQFTAQPHAEVDLVLSAPRPVVDPPTVTFDELHHVGALDPDEKWSRGVSYEGSGLSVSRHPDEWRHIARLGDAPTWTIDTSGLGFVDVHAISEADVENIIDWAEEAGLVERVEGWTVTWFDEELDSDVSIIVTDSADAAFYEDEEDHDIVATSTVVPTARMHERVGFEVPAGLAADQAIICYFEADHPEVDGMWWEDRFDPDALSAPRGVIFRRSIDQVKPKIL